MFLVSWPFSKEHRENAQDGGAYIIISLTSNLKGRSPMVCHRHATESVLLEARAVNSSLGHPGDLSWNQGRQGLHGDTVPWSSPSKAGQLISVVWSTIITLRDLWAPSGIW